MAASSSPPRVSFSLARADRNLDHRIDAARHDLADIALAGGVFAPYFAEPHLLRVISGPADLRESPAAEARLGSQLLHGEQFAVLESEAGWSWGYGLHDHYVGYVETARLGDAPAPDHIVAARLAPVYAGPDRRGEPIGERPMGERFATTPADSFMAIEGGFVLADDMLALETRAPDPIAIGERLIGTPYLWGGRSGAGVDCSGLVQLTCAFAGIAAPRDSDQQQRALGAPLAEGEPLRRGDIVFFPNHVGVMRDAMMLLHATQHHGATVAEPLADVVARIGREHPRPVLERRRVVA